MLMQRQPQVDPAFPYLDDALDPERATRAFAKTLLDTGFPTQSLRCSVERVRIKSGNKAVIGYRLIGIDAQGATIDQHVMVSLWPDGDPSRLGDMGNRHTKPGFGPASATIDSLAGQAWFFPNDRKVRSIAALLRGPPGLADGSSEIVHYVPEQGCTVRYHAHGCRIYGKARADDRATIADLVDRTARQAGELPVRLARVIHHDPMQHILWQEEVQGSPLNPADVLADPSLWARRIVIAVHGFQKIMPPPGLKTLTGISMAETLARRTARTVSAMPTLSQGIEALATLLCTAMPSVEPPLLSHCDLHPGNLLWDGNTFAMIDLDTAALAPPGRDYGSLIASLIHKAIEMQTPDAAILEMVDAFRAAAKHVRDLNWFIAASLIGERLYRCGTRLKSPSQDLRSRLIALARLVLENDHG
jgi:hypothetical protein